MTRSVKAAYEMRTRTAESTPTASHPRDADGNPIADDRLRHQGLENLRNLQRDLVGDEDELEMLLGYAEESVTDSALGRRWGVDRRTARKRMQQYLERLRQRWLGRLAQVAAELLATGPAAITLDPMRLRPMAPTESFVVAHEALFVGVAGRHDVQVFLDETQTLIFGPRSVALALQCLPAHTRVAILIQTRRVPAAEQYPAREN